MASAPVLCYAPRMVMPQSMEVCAALGAACADDGKRKVRPGFRLGRILPWHGELALLLATGPIAFKTALIIFNWLGI